MSEATNSLSIPLEKTCLFCEHFNFDMGGYGYSDWTPGTDARFECFEGVWDMENCGSTGETFAENIAKAQHCDKFKCRT